MSLFISHTLDRIKAEKLIELLNEYVKKQSVAFSFDLEPAVENGFYYIKVSTVGNVAFEAFWLERLEGFCDGFWDSHNFQCNTV